MDGGARELEPVDNVYVSWGSTDAFSQPVGSLHTVMLLDL